MSTYLVTVNAPDLVALRKLLKAAKRGYGVRCVGVRRAERPQEPRAQGEAAPTTPATRSGKRGSRRRPSRPKQRVPEVVQ